MKKLGHQAPGLSKIAIPSTCGSFLGLVDAERQQIDVEPGLGVVEQRDVERAVVDGLVDAEQWNSGMTEGNVVSAGHVVHTVCPFHRVGGVLLSFVVAVPEHVWTFSCTRRSIFLLTTKLNQ